MKSLFRNPNKYCSFYKDIGHWTKECRHLKWEIEHLLFDGYLGDLMNGNIGLRRENREVPHNPSQR